MTKGTPYALALFALTLVLGLLAALVGSGPAAAALIFGAVLAGAAAFVVALLSVP